MKKPELRTGNIGLNNKDKVMKIRQTIQSLAGMSSSYFPLKVKSKRYFEIGDSKKLPEEPGWYIILENRKPIYTGRADNINKRLNTKRGTTDNFANELRKYDSERNFIKKFNELRIFKKMEVCVITEQKLRRELGTKKLEPIDGRNIEKVINIFRCHFTYK